MSVFSVSDISELEDDHNYYDTEFGAEPYCRELHEMELNIKYYSLQAEIIKCKQSLFQLRADKRRKRSSNSSNVPDGQTNARNTERQPPTDNSSAAGTSETLPSLQSYQRQKCLWCDFPAHLYCGSCRVAPYCSPKCQQADWIRHQDLCHNLLPISSEAPARPQSPADRNRGNNSHGTRMMEEEENPEEERPIVQSIESQQDDEDWD